MQLSTLGWSGSSVAFMILSVFSCMARASARRPAFLYELARLFMLLKRVDVFEPDLRRH